MGKSTIKNTDKKTLEHWFSLLTLGRLLDERAPNYLKQAIGWSYHAPYAGHDGIQLAIGQIFKKNEDHLFPYYRDMLTVISAGMNAEEIILNGISKATDLASGGRHMSNHFAKPSWNIHNVSSCTGNHVLHAVGVARGIKYYNKSAVAICSQGESSVSEGYVYEAINGASREILPVIFVFQDNGYGISVPKHEQTANEFCAENFSGFKNLKIFYCNGLDIFDSYSTMVMAKEHVLKGLGPAIVHAKCVRIGPHSNSDRHELYRDEAELKHAKSLDPYLHFEELLIKNAVFNKNALDKIKENCKKDVLAAHSKAMKAPDPDPLSIHQYVYPESYQSSQTQIEENAPEVSLLDAINQTLKAEFRHNPDTFIWGQDMANKDKGGIFNVSKGMQQEFGPQRVFNGPIAEDYILGTANGLSRFDPKIRIVVEGAEFADYFWPAMEQLIEMTHEYWRTNGQFSPNVTIRLASGGYIGGGLYHSQNLEGTFATLPGIRVVCPSFADDAAGLLRTAMRSKGPTLFLEPKALYNSKSAYAKINDDICIPFGQAKIRKEGSDLTIVTYGNTTHFCLEAAENIQKESNGKYSLEVIDLRSIVPLDKETIKKSLEKTNRVLIVHEDKVHGGFGGEIASIIMEEMFNLLDAPIMRLGSTFTPVGFNRILERAILPNTVKIQEKAFELLQY